MSLNPQTLIALEACGVQQIHLDALLRFLHCQENGSFTWHGRAGKLDHCELKLSYPSRGHTVQRVSQTVFGEEE